MTAGRRGACKLCEWELSSALNELIKQEWNATQCQKWAEPFGFKFDRKTFYAHKDSHITAPIVTAVQQARANPVIKPKDNREFLEMVRDLAAEKLINEPETVTVDQGLNAVKVMEQKKDSRESFAVLLAKAITGPRLENVETQVIVGEFREIEESEVHG